MSDFSVKITQPGEDPNSIEVWGKGYQPGTSSGMTCQICSAVVRQSPGDAKRHREWHAKLEGGSPPPDAP